MWVNSFPHQSGVILKAYLCVHKMATTHSILKTALHRLKHVARTLSIKTATPMIKVDPSDALIDEPVSISVSGLREGQKVTLSATLQNNKKDFLSCAHYTADVKGRINTNVVSSEGGSFSGVEPMGLFWSLTPSEKHRKGVRLVKTDVTSPLVVRISVLSNHINLSSVETKIDTSEVLASTHVKRWYMGTGVQRIPLREGRLRGALFIPPGDGPFPAILDMFGGSGGLFDFRAALLASRGFLTLSLAYIGFEDLPDLDELDFGYFTDAADWLSGHSHARSGGIGVMGVSFGASLAYMLATYCPQIRAAVTINGPPVSPLPDQKIEGKWIKGNMLNFTGDDHGYGKPSYGFSDSNIEILPIWRQNVKILSLISGDDKSYSPDLYRSQMERIPEDKRENIECIVYPGAGHLLEPPYTPLCRQSYIAGAFVEGSPGMMFLWGGEPKSHAVAQEDAWRRTQKHFNTYVT